MEDNKPQQKQKNDKNQKLIKTIRIYVIPIIAVIIFLGGIVILVLPKIGDILNQYDTINSNQQQVSDLSSTLDKLKGVSAQFNTYSKQLDVINSIAPTGFTEVVKFRDKITALAVADNIQIISEKLSESNIDTSTINSDQASFGGLVLQEVPFIFTVDGKYSDIVKFITDLSNIDDFIVINEMSLTTALPSANTSVQSFDTKSAQWDLKLNIDKFQFNTPDKQKLDNSYLNVSIDSQISKTMEDYINKRLTELDSSLTNQTQNGSTTDQSSQSGNNTSTNTNSLQNTP